MVRAGVQQRLVLSKVQDRVCPKLVNRELHTGAVRPRPGFAENLFFISSRNGIRTRVFEMLLAFRAFRGRALLREMVQPHISVGSLSSRQGL